MVFGWKKKVISVACLGDMVEKMEWGWLWFSFVVVMEEKVVG
jgi:hypothetical protein